MRLADRYGSIVRGRKRVVGGGEEGPLHALEDFRILRQRRRDGLPAVEETDGPAEKPLQRLARNQLRQTGPISGRQHENVAELAVVAR